MYRKIEQELLLWKESKGRKPLILLGARQVGKTWVMKHFGDAHFESVAYLNCDENPKAKMMFEGGYDVARMLTLASAIAGVRVVPGKTLLILDEIQEAPKGLHSLKYFCENCPELHVVAAGSLLGITLGRGESFPVGKVDMVNVRPMDFSEFLLAMGEDILHDVLLSGDFQTIDMLASKCIDLLRQYYFVGGMPEVVSAYVERRDPNEVRTKQKRILDAYRRDISKHTTPRESMRIGQVLTSLPSQLSKENKKFIYSVLRPGARAADYELAIQWLIDAGIVCKVPRVREICSPLRFYEDLVAFKLFFLDCGLLACMAGAPAAQMLIGDSVFREFKGAFTEQYVLQQMLVQGLEPFYWSSDSTPAEIDFVVQTEDGAVPVEVKAEDNVKAKSLATYINRFPERNLKGLRFSMLGYQDQGWMENVPLYMAGYWFNR